MFDFLIKRLRGNKPGKPVPEQNVVVDLSRAIPGYVPAPVTHQTSEVLAAPDERRIRDKTDRLKMPRKQNVGQIADRAERAVDALSDKHDSWARSDLEHLSVAWENVRHLENITGQLAHVQRCAHNLKGMASTYGHPAISRLSASLCQLLDSPNASQQHALINLHIEACRAAYLEGNVNQGGNAIAQSVCVALEAQVKRMLEG